MSLTERGRWGSTVLDERGRFIFGSLTERGLLVTGVSTSGVVMAVSGTSNGISTITASPIAIHSSSATVALTERGRFVLGSIDERGRFVFGYLTERGQLVTGLSTAILVVIQSSGSSNGVASVTAVFSGTKAVSGTVSGVAVVSSTPNIVQILSGSTSGLATITASIYGGKVASGNIGGTSIVTANSIENQLAPGLSQGTTNIFATFAGTFVGSGTILGTSSVTNTLNTAKPTVGLSDGNSGVSSVVKMMFVPTGTINGKTDITGFVQGVSQIVVNNASKTLQRWKLGQYPLTYNPKTNERNIRVTTGEEVTANGIISNPNKFFDDEINFTIDLYDKPTYFSENALMRNLADNYYAGVTEKRYNGELYCLRSNGTFDVINKEGNGGITRNATLTNVTGTPIAITHMENNKLATIFINAGVAYLNISDELGVQISKYTISDVDYVNASSIAWDYKSSLYVLSKQGKIFTSNPNNGATSLVYQSDDFSSNKSSNISAYNGIHFLNNYMGFIVNGSISYMDNNFTRLYSTDIPINAIGKITGLSCGYTSGDFYALSKNNLVKIYPNTCGIDITTIKNQVANGFVQISDEKNSTLYVIIKSMGIDRKYNKQDARYEVKFSGKIMS